MVRMPGSSSSGSDATVKTEPGAPPPADSGSTLVNQEPTRPSEGQVSGGTTDDITKDELEEKSPVPPVAPKGAIAGSATLQDPPSGLTRPERGRKSRQDAPKSTSKPTSKKTTKGASTRKKLRAPDVTDPESQPAVGSTWRSRSDAELEFAAHRNELFEFLDQDPLMQLLQLRLLSDLQGPIPAPTTGTSKLDLVKATLRVLEDAGLVAGPFEAHEVFEMTTKEIKTAYYKLQDLLRPLVGQLKTQPAATSAGRVSAESSPYQTGVSGSSSRSSSEPARMSLGTTVASTFQSRPTPLVYTGQHWEPTRQSQATQQAGVGRLANISAGDPQIATLMEQFAAILGSRRQDPVVTTPKAGHSDVDMESADSSHEYDPDDLDSGPMTTRVVATATAPAMTAPRMRTSAVSDLKEFSSKDGDEDGARAWLSKAQSAFSRDQADEDERCLVFGNLLTGPARNWYRQLSRSTRRSWPNLYELFQVQYCGRGTSVARQYYHARRRPDETPLEYLFRLNVAALRAKIKVKDGTAEVRREHVEHFIDTLEDPDLGARLIPLRLEDADVLEETLRAMQRAETRHKKPGPKYRPRPVPPPPTPKPAAASRAARAVKVMVDNDSSESDPGSSDDDGDLRRVYLTATDAQKEVEASKNLTPAHEDRTQGGWAEDGQNQPVFTNKQAAPNSGPDKFRRERCSHCGSQKHTDLGCWRRLTCQKCGKRGHPTDRCLFVCRGCGDLHDIGRCPMEEFYNLVRQWYDPTKHAGMLPANAEKMLN